MASGVEAPVDHAPRKRDKAADKRQPISRFDSAFEDLERPAGPRAAAPSVGGTQAEQQQGAAPGGEAWMVALPTDRVASGEVAEAVSARARRAAPSVVRPRAPTPPPPAARQRRARPSQLAEGPASRRAPAVPGGGLCSTNAPRAPAGGHTSTRQAPAASSVLARSGIIARPAERGPAARPPRPDPTPTPTAHRRAPAQLICSICRGIVPPDGASQTDCRHLFCSSCIGAALDRGGRPACPDCSRPLARAQLRPLREANPAVYKLLGDIKVRRRRPGARAHACTHPHMRAPAQRAPTAHPPAGGAPGSAAQPLPPPPAIKHNRSCAATASARG